MIAAAAVALAMLVGANPAALGTERAQHQHHEHKPQPPAKPAEDHSAHTAKEQRQGLPKEPIPPLTDADRAAAFPEHLGGHTVHDRPFNVFVLFEQLEWQGTGSGGMKLENTSWFGGDIDRLWVRAEGESEGGRLDHASVDALWGHSFSPWWDVVVGVRQDFRPGDPLTWAAIGIQGLAPQWFEVEVTGYVGPGGRSRARLEAEYELLLTNRLILQPVAELELFGKRDAARGAAAGFSSLESGLRLRYELRREFAPYVGVTWNRKLFGTADLARAEGGHVSSARLAFGLRTWF